MVYAHEELADLYGRLGRLDDRIAELEALRGLDPGPARQVALGLATHAPVNSTARLHAGKCGGEVPRSPLHVRPLGRVWLEKAEPRLDRVDLSKALGVAASELAPPTAARR